MRWLGLLGCLLWISTANAQPAPAAPAGAPPDALPPPMAPPSALPPTLAPAPPLPPTLAPPGLAPVAQSMAPVEPAEAPEVGDAYHWQILAADAASIACMASGNRALVTTGGLGYFVAAPAIHGSHDQGVRMALSLGLRVGLPLAGALGFLALAESGTHCAKDDSDCDRGADYAVIAGVGLGMLSAMVLDAALLGRSHEIHKERRATWAPRVSVAPKQASIGVLGQF